MIIGFIIWSIVAVIFLIIGISERKAKEPVGFWANVKRPGVEDIEDVENYNKAVSNIWLVFSILFEALGIPFLFCRQNSPVFLLVIIGAMFLVIGIMVAYTFVEKKYKKK